MTATSQTPAKPVVTPGTCMPLVVQAVAPRRRQDDAVLPPRPDARPRDGAVLPAVHPPHRDVISH
ncbi:hypothetical protein ACFPM0_00085 [Pseudonocardia sulfidoxydans]|uniref:hypothetical protein n=1 Tax=Pseudonocardia sulfidoxydans TaxID=54011 RepID=UPI003608FEE7